MNPRLKGKEYQEVELRVERERVIAFADAVGEDNQLFHDPEAARAAGYPEQLAPPTFPTVMQIMVSGQAVVDPELGLDYSRVVHGEQEYEWLRPVTVGDVLRARPRIADIYERGPNEFLVIEAEILDDSGATVVRARSVLLSRGTAER